MDAFIQGLFMPLQKVCESTNEGRKYQRYIGMLQALTGTTTNDNISSIAPLSIKTTQTFVSGYAFFKQSPTSVERAIFLLQAALLIVQVVLQSIVHAKKSKCEDAKNLCNTIDYFDALFQCIFYISWFIGENNKRKNLPTPQPSQLDLTVDIENQTGPVRCEKSTQTHHHSEKNHVKKHHHDYAENQESKCVDTNLCL